jgi:hypothetical protein
MIIAIMGLYMGAHLTVMITFNFKLIKQDTKRYYVKNCCLTRYQKQMRKINGKVEDVILLKKLVEERKIGQVEAAEILTQANERKAARIAKKEFYNKLREEKDLSIHAIAKDGNCMFAAVSHQIFGTTIKHREVRTLAAGHILSRPSYFRHFVEDGNLEEHCAAMMKTGVWGDHLELEAISQYFKCPIEVYKDSLTPMKTYHENSKHKLNQPVRLLYSGNSHYDSLVTTQFKVDTEFKLLSAPPKTQHPSLYVDEEDPDLPIYGPASRPRPEEFYKQLEDNEKRL